MKLIPEIRVRRGKIIEPASGNPIDPISVMRALQSALSTDEEDAVFYIIDEGGMERNNFDMGLLERLGEEFRIWFKGGFRRAEFLMDAFILGAEVAVMDSSTILSMKELKSAVDMSDNVSFSIEFRKFRRWNDVPTSVEELSGILNGMNLHSTVFSCDSEKEISYDSFRGLKFSSGCGEKGVDGLIVPYTLIHHLRE